MCPACFTTLAVTVVGATSTGGLAALLARMWHRTDPKPHKEMEPWSRTESCRETNGSGRGSRFWPRRRT